MSLAKFSASDDDLLVELIEGQPIIWCMTEKDYKNASRKELIWNEIGEMMNKSAANCKSRWKNIKDYYQKQKKDRTNQPTGTAATKRRKGYWERLHFLDSVPGERSTRSNILNDNTPLQDSAPEETSIDGDAYDPPAVENVVDYPECSHRGNNTSASAPEARKKKRLRNELDVAELLQCRQQELRKNIAHLMYEEEDEIDLFFKTMAATVKKFNSSLKRQAKIQVFSIVTELEGLNQSGSSFN